MHREISQKDSVFKTPTPVVLYAFTAFLGVLILIDVLPFLGAWAGIATFDGLPRTLFTLRFAQLAAVLGGARILYGALQSLLDGNLGADLALALACIGAILLQQPLVAAEVVFIGLVGECLEAFTFDRTQRAMRQFVEVFPQRCWLLRDGQEIRTLVSDLQVGDVVVVKPGAKIPVDGVVHAGRSAVDTSALTGENLPQDKDVGDDVLAGSVNQFGNLTIEARKVGAQTVAGRVVELTARALKDKGQMERTADRMARYFLPVVLGLAVLTFAVCMLHFSGGWFRAPALPKLSMGQAIQRSAYPALSVLVVACPCALILATPAAVIAALGRLAGTGILVKSGAALERLAEVQAFAFDKTGTLSEGRLELGDIYCEQETASDDLLRLAASAELASEHPLAQVLVRAARERQLTLETPSDFKAHPGAGISAQLATGAVLVGTRKLLVDQGLTISPAVEEYLQSLDAAGQSALLVAHGGRVLGALGVRDVLRPEAENVLLALREAGIDPILMLTGDRHAAAHSLAKPLALTAIHAELLPEAKAKLVEELLGTKKTAMVGDGINDAPALARAHVGLAIGMTGSDLAAEAGDIVLMGPPLRNLPLLLRLSRETVRIIRQNIIWFAFVVNLVGVVVTAWLWPLFAPADWFEQSPVAAVIYHQLGSFLVLVNSMRLLWFERPSESASWIGLKGKLRDVDVWIDNHLDFAGWVHDLEHHWKKASFAVFGLAVGGWALSGMTVIPPDEFAVQRRFGRPIADLEPGWTWTIPWPIDDVVRVSKRLKTVDVGFRETPENLKGERSWMWTSAHRKENRLQEEAMMMTGDSKLVDVQATVRYRIVDARAYLFGVSQADEMLRTSAETVFRQLIASSPFLDLLTVSRQAFETEALQRLEAKLEEYEPRGLGLKIEGIALLDLHPPSEVVKSYYKVAEAMADKDRRVNLARERALSRKITAEAEAMQIVARAQGQARETILEAEGELVKMQAQLAGRNEIPFAQQAFLGLQKLLTGKDDTAEKLRAQQALVDFRIYWDVIGKGLRGRELLIIDAPESKIRGRRDLYLFDPEQFRPGLVTPRSEKQ